MRFWAHSEAQDLRKRAVILRLENGEPIAGLLWAGFTPKDLEVQGRRDQAGDAAAGQFGGSE